MFGFDIERETKKIRRIMNMVAGGEQSGYGILTVREQLWMFSQFYGLGAREGWARVDELIEAVGLAEQRSQRVSGLSTGQRQKMNFARGLLNDPWILFLDEPTLGLDVSAARAVRELVTGWQASVPGRTVLLTTHYMAEADEMCERIAIVDRGRVLAIGTPAELKQRVQRESIFRIELDRLAGGPGRAGPVAGRRERDGGHGRQRGRRGGSPAPDRRGQPRPRRGRGARRGRRARSAGSARESSPCASRSPPSRRSSSSSSAAASTTPTSPPAGTGPVAGRRVPIGPRRPTSPGEPEPEEVG